MRAGFTSLNNADTVLSAKGISGLLGLRALNARA
jgi:hypothetical protein